MNIRLILGSVLMLGFLLTPIAHANPPTDVQVEVNFLLGYIEMSGCEFYRNGTWRDSRAAQAHIRDKYEYLVAINLIKTTDDFIEKAATKSSLSGKAYGVRCNGGATITSNQWLRDELACFRDKKAGIDSLGKQASHVAMNYAQGASRLVWYRI